MARIAVVQNVLNDVATGQRRMGQNARKVDTDLTATSGVLQIMGRNLDQATQRLLHEMGPAQCQKVIAPWGEAQERYAQAVAALAHVKKLITDANVHVDSGIMELEKIVQQIASAGR